MLSPISVSLHPRSHILRSSDLECIDAKTDTMDESDVAMMSELKKKKKRKHKHHKHKKDKVIEKEERIDKQERYVMIMLSVFYFSSFYYRKI